MKKKSVIICLIIAVLVLSSCSWLIPDNLEVTKVQINGERKIEIRQGEVRNLSVTVTPNGATDKSVRWSSSSNALTVDQDGKITAVRQNAGVNVTATSNSNPDVKDSIRVVILSPKPENIIIDVIGSSSLTLGTNRRISVDIEPVGSKGFDIVFSSSNTDVISVKYDDSMPWGAEIQANSVGTADIIVSIPEFGLSSKKTYTVTKRPEGYIEVEEIKIGSYNYDSVYIDETLRLYSTITPTNATNQKVFWESKDPSIAEVSAGVVTGKAVGTTTIYAISDSNPELKAEFVVNVKKRGTISSIEFTNVDDSQELHVGEDLQLKVKTIPASDNSLIRWESSNPEIAVVDNNGYITTLKYGQNAIYAYSSEDDAVFARVYLTVRDFTDNDYTYYQRGIVSKYNGKDSEVTVPAYDSFNNPITVIGNGTFLQKREITNVTLPLSITRIEENAFSSCSSLSTVTSLSNGSTIDVETRAFSSSGVTSVLSGSYVNPVGKHIFSGCAYLTDVRISELAEFIPDGTFEGCQNLPSIDIPESVRVIGDSAFYTCYHLVEITGMEGVTEIGAKAFNSCQALESINIPDSVISLGEYAFASCKMLRK